MTIDVVLLGPFSLKLSVAWRARWNQEKPHMRSKSCGVLVCRDLAEIHIESYAYTKGLMRILSDRDL